MTDEFHGWKQIASQVGWHETTCRRWAARRDELRLPVVQIGRRVLMRRAAYERWLKERERAYSAASIH